MMMLFYFCEPRTLTIVCHYPIIDTYQHSGTIMANANEFLKELADLMDRHDVMDISVDTAPVAGSDWSGEFIQVWFTDEESVTLNHDTYFSSCHLRKLLK